MWRVSNLLIRGLIACIAAGALATAMAGAPSQIGVFRDGQWFLDADGDGVYTGPPNDIYYEFGQAGDMPVVGDWNGDGFTKIGIFRNGRWWLDYNGNGVWDEGIDKYIVFGKAGDKPIVGDWNGDGKTKIGVYRVGGQYGEYMLDTNGTYAWDAGDNYLGRPLYSSYDTPLVGDWNGAGLAKIGRQFGDATVNHYPLFTLYRDLVDEHNYDSVAFGLKGDIPVIGDWNGDGRSKVGVIRDGQWIVDYNGNGQWDGTPTDKAFYFGNVGDIPVVGKRWKPLL